MNCDRPVLAEYMFDVNGSMSFKIINLKGLHKAFAVFQVVYNP